ncbi:mandelate racemase/muconate lactonizing enzyme family protein [Mesorhizobium sp. ANAO-SY3R2]|uniref:mandelate racemase/muconate lactonizing enzyme family protein n=1 Tax=Mesorhizobium sp. ANAO-SY3R2 TaxID=3166644 RepID=UPI00366F1046
MKIRRIETFCDKYTGFVRITDETGAQGWGQISNYNSDITAQVMHRQVAPWSLGVETDDLDDLLDRIEEREHKFPGTYIRRAMAGLDTAIWDLRGKAAEKPVVELLGGKPGKLRAYASSMKRDITPADEAERFMRLRDTYGFDAFKFRVGAEVGRNSDEWPGRTEEIIPTLRKALGDHITLLADANSCYSPARAIEVGRMLEANGVVHFEEPCPYWELDQTRQVAEALNMAVAGGEQDSDLRIWQRMIDMRAVDIVQPDVCYIGGIARTLRVARMAAAAGIPVTPHCANLSLVTLFTMHVLAAIPNAGDYLELSIEGPDYYPWQEGLLRTNPYTVVDGKVTISSEPGWGIEIEPEWLARSAYQMSEIA